jgi:hypothetical protein
LIVYRKTHGLRVTRAAAPEPPFWSATAISPYSARRGGPVAIDYAKLQASLAEKLEVNVCDSVTDELERSTGHHPLHDPVLIDATGFAELVFRRGEEALAFCAGQSVDPIFLISTHGAVPESMPDGSVLAISVWPLEFHRFEPLFTAARERGHRWGVAVPVIFPVTTGLIALRELADAAAARGAAFLAALPVEVDPTARQAIASSLALDDDDETYTALFHSDLETIHVATERHIAALAAERGIQDFVTPPRWEKRSNWNAAVLLTLTASRMLAMQRDVELAWTLWRSAKVVASLDKPLARVAEAASLAIIEALDVVSVEILTEWLESGEAEFATAIAREWRLRRDHGIA